MPTFELIDDPSIPPKIGGGRHGMFHFESMKIGQKVIVHGLDINVMPKILHYYKRKFDMQFVTRTVGNTVHIVRTL